MEYRRHTPEASYKVVRPDGSTYNYPMGIPAGENASHHNGCEGCPMETIAGARVYIPEGIHIQLAPQPTSHGPRPCNRRPGSCVSANSLPESELI